MSISDSAQQAGPRTQRAAAAGRGERQKRLSICNQLLDLEERRIRLLRALYKCDQADPESQTLPLPDPRSESDPISLDTELA